jgi:hypothetical protein
MMTGINAGSFIGVGLSSAVFAAADCNTTTNLSSA